MKLTAKRLFIIIVSKGEEEELLEMAALRGVDEAHEVKLTLLSSSFFSS